MPSGVLSQSKVPYSIHLSRVLCCVPYKYRKYPLSMIEVQRHLLDYGDSLSKQLPFHPKRNLEVYLTSRESYPRSLALQEMEHHWKRLPLFRKLNRQVFQISHFSFWNLHQQIQDESEKWLPSNLLMELSRYLGQVAHQSVS